jgi:hypothetical protein
MPRLGGARMCVVLHSSLKPLDYLFNSDTQNITKSQPYFGMSGLLFGGLLQNYAHIRASPSARRSKGFFDEYLAKSILFDHDWSTPSGWCRARVKMMCVSLSSMGYFLESDASEYCNVKASTVSRPDV